MAGPATTGPEAGDRLATPRFLVLCLASFGYFTALGSTWPVVPAFVEHDLGGGGVAVGLSVGAFGFSAALLRPLIGPLGDRRGRRFLLLLGSVGESLPEVDGPRLDGQRRHFGKDRQPVTLHPRHQMGVRTIGHDGHSAG